ncbi:helical backbone metal receptor [Chitiniphilus eburneus]|uniref:Cobalamin-binding protein n=1 Tax=Chitiniphilus eburneus TaxID=2571148 RepID=A0A4U0Q993_9NEIS|nr:helical backbone metal receptor [Chitiniphilus eburneus]TJZ77500.1 cobalamin-binding protein [Chitiniphilus eburneus]
MSRWLCLALGLWAMPAWAAVDVRDDAGNRVRLEQPATRVITLAPHATELIAALAPRTLVAVDRYSNYPEQVRKLPQVGDYAAINVEAVIALRPDLIVIWEGKAATELAARLARLAIPVFISRPASVEDIATNLERLGVLVGKPEQGKALARRQRDGLTALQRRYAGKPPVRVFLQLGVSPMFTVSRKAFLGQALADCGAMTPYAEDRAVTPQASLEAVLGFAPELILVDGPAEALADWQRFPELPAVANGAVIALSGDRFVRPGPRFVEAAMELCRRVDAARARKIP